METVTPDRLDATDLVAGSLRKVEAHVLQERYRGYDPYDALTSPIFRLPVLRSSKWIRLAATQALKRSSYNLRPLLGIRKGYNPVTLGFVLQACAYLAQARPAESDVYRRRALDLVSELDRVRSPAGHACWGYDFDWEARYGRLPAGAPTIVATGLVSNALFVAYRLLGIDDALGLCESAARFVLEDVPRLPGAGDTFCWAYFPGDDQRVLNATMKGARLCAQIYSVTDDEAYLEPARRTSAFVAAHQEEDGRWPYAVGDRRTWADSFHTAYVLDALDEYELCSGDARFRPTVEKGWRYFRGSFFEGDRVPKYYASGEIRVDATVCAQSLLTLCRFEDFDTAAKVALWTIENMQCDDGHFAYQRRGRTLVKIPYMRWSSAYLYLGLSAIMRTLAELDADS